MGVFFSQMKCKKCGKVYVAYKSTHDGSIHQEIPCPDCGAPENEQEFIRTLDAANT